MSDFDSWSTTKTLIVGSGSIANRHARVLRGLGVQELHHFSKSGRTLSPEHGATVSLSSQEGIPDTFDLVVICSKTQDHVNDLFEFTSRGEKILLEKPVSGSLAELEKVASALPKLGHCSVSFPLRFIRGLWEVSSLCISDSLEGATIRAECSSWLPDWRPDRDFRNGYWNESGSGGVLLELIHEFDYLQVLFGPLTSITLTDRSLGILGLDTVESVDAEITTDRTSSISLHLDFCSREASRFVEVTNTPSAIRWDFLDFELKVRPPKSGVTAKLLPDDDRDEWFERQYMELMNPGAHPLPVCSLANAVRLNEEVLKAWERRK